jgi:23S rRNA (guanine745-N1)-methyltransferase
VAARARLLAAGVGRHILEAVVDRASALVSSEEAVVDLGSGSGDGLAQLTSRQPLTAVGIDLSTAAVEHAARRFPHITWVVANADRRLPILDHSVSLILSLHARRNAAECGRTLSRHGWLIAAVPAPDDLVELRLAVQGIGIERARGEVLLEEHAAQFALVERTTIRERHLLGRDALRDLLCGTYRAARASAAQRAEQLTALDVTLSSEVLVLRART